MGGGRLRGVVAHGGSTVRKFAGVITSLRPSSYVIPLPNSIVLGLTEVQQKHNINSYLVTELNVIIVNVVSRQWL